MPGITDSNPSSSVSYFTIHRRLLLLDSIIAELLKDGLWTTTLREKLCQLEELIPTAPDPDFGYWKNKLAIYWKRYAGLKVDPTLAAATASREALLEGDSWKIVICKGAIIVTQSDGQMKMLQFETGCKSEASLGHIFKATPVTSVPIRGKDDLKSPQQAPLPPGRPTNGGDNCGQQSSGPSSANWRQQPSPAAARVSYQQTPPPFRGRSQSCTRIGASSMVQQQGQPRANDCKANELFYGNGSAQGKSGQNLGNKNGNLPSGGAQTGRPCMTPQPPMINNLPAASNGPTPSPTGTNNHQSVMHSNAQQTPKPLRSSKQLQGGKTVSIESAGVKQQPQVSSNVTAMPPPPPASTPVDDTFNWLQDDPKLKSAVTPTENKETLCEEAVTGTTNRYMVPLESQHCFNFVAEQQQQQDQGGSGIKVFTAKPARMPAAPTPAGPSVEVTAARPASPSPVESTQYCFNCYSWGHSKSECTNKGIKI